MAKYNLMLGTATASVGDVTLMRRQGKQVSRVRIRAIGNPKTYGQAFQRAAMANITKFFAPLAVVLEKSWEGQSKAGSYSAFIKKNVELARKAPYLAKKGADFMPMPYYLSMGTLTPVNAEIDTTKNVLFIDGVQISNKSLGSFTNAFIANNPSAKNGDQITLLAFVKNEDGYTPIWCRFFLDSTSDVDLDTILQGFKLVNTGTGGANFYYFQPVNVADGIIAGAIILSRWENGKWRRSPEQLDCALSIDSLLSSQQYKDACIESFRTGDTANPSDVYLNGQEFGDGTINTAVAGGSATSVQVGNILKVYIVALGAFVPIVEDENGNKYLFKNGVATSVDYQKILTDSGLVMEDVPSGYTAVEYQPDSTASAKAGSYQNYQYLRSQGFTNGDLGL